MGHVVRGERALAVGTTIKLTDADHHMPDSESILHCGTHCIFTPLPMHGLVNGTVYLCYTCEI